MNIPPAQSPLEHRAQKWTSAFGAKRCDIKSRSARAASGLKQRALITLSLSPFIMTVPGPLPAMAETGEPPERVISLIVYGDDPCPTDAGKEDEIVVCARRPESERYRIPKKLREKPAPVGSVGWASQVAEMEQTGRAITPGSCSPNGSYGFTGCTAALLRQWYAEKRMKDSEGVP